MFTGLIDHIGTIKEIASRQRGLALTIQTHFTHLTLGESIAIDGACLTVTEVDNDSFVVELSEETVNLTIANHYLPGHLVNLERALKIGDALGGHFVTGHIDQTITLEAIIPHHEFQHMIFSGFNAENLSYLSQKGSIAINGVSLTINQVENNRLHVMLIPHTLQRTNLSALSIGDHVNSEFDLLAKLVAKQLRGIIHEHTV